MDPEPLTSFDWDRIRELIIFLWLFLAAVVAFGGAFLLAQAILPSLVKTGHLPARLLRLRPLLYLFSFLALGLAGFLLARALSLTSVIDSFYPRIWM